MRVLKTRTAQVVTVLVTGMLLGGCLEAPSGNGLSSCSVLGPCSSVGGAGTGSGSGSIGTGGAESPFYLNVKTYWDTDSGKAFPTVHQPKLIATVSGVDLNSGTAADLSEDICQIAPGTSKTSDAIDRNITCGVTIPRAQLFFSTLDLEINASKDAECDIVYYWPYGYQASSSATFTSRWQTTPLDCSVTPTPNACYSGPVVDTPGFPTFTGLYENIYDKTKTYSHVYSVPSANTKLRQDNRWTSYRPQGLPGGNLAGDWNWRCVQKGDSQNFSITLRIIPVRDEDPFWDAGNNHFGWLDDDDNDRGLSGQ